VVNLLAPEEYLAIERKAEFKSEYYRGRMYLMAGGTSLHALIIGNVGSELVLALKKNRGCRVYSSNLRVLVYALGFYTYPDLSIGCGDAEYSDEERDTITNPVVIFEVLSESTEAYDRGEKFELYRGIQTLREYVLISQAKAYVERFVRQDDHSWKLYESSGMDSRLVLESLGCEIALSDIYDKVEFRPQEQARG
jgi:Uma2 family endonuclease